MLKPEQSSDGAAGDREIRMETTATRSTGSSNGNGLTADLAINAIYESTPDSDAFVTLDGEDVYRINRFDSMDPFLMTLVSDTDLWMYCSSYGPLTAGRVNEDHCLFPYVTDDVLHRGVGQTGPITIIRVDRPGLQPVVWEPFSRFPAGEQLERNVYKSILSNVIIFEEVHQGLAMAFRYRWTTSEEFGFVRTATLESHPEAHVAHVDILDGLVNLLPAGVGLATQQRYSCLVDGYTRCEIDPETGLGLFAMTSQIVDHAEPAESLSANVVWSRGLPRPRHLLSTDQIPVFLRGQRVDNEFLLTGRRGAFLVTSSLTLPGGANVSWDIAADASRDQTQVENLCAVLRNDASPIARVQKSAKSGRETLERYVAAADGNQLTGDTLATSHHAACTLFNIMRGGIFSDNYEVVSTDFREFVQARNRQTARANAAFLSNLPDTINYVELLRDARSELNSRDLIRLVYEYLPLTFSRRHGDPSRPWNRFDIRVKRADGRPILNYQGNWRDIFQNWEALCASFPGFTESIIAKFVNASTVDGFNPYRVTRDGIDWEALNPEDPWSNIGYWGDHQIIYLLKLLESSHRYHPNVLEELLTTPGFTYANVPYRLKPYCEILQDSKNTIVFDKALEARIQERIRTVGADGKLLTDGNGQIYHSTLTEKLMVSILSKLSNFIPGGGIWMNTQRPEWNDANNALVGNGVSVVTLCYLRRHLAFCMELFATRHDESVLFSQEVADWMHGIATVLHTNRAMLSESELTGSEVRETMDALGAVFSDYRERVYRDGLTGAAPISFGACRRLCELGIEWLDHTIRSNQRQDGMYHSYNLLDLTVDARLDRLPVMLEGQVAVLSADILTSDEAAQLVDSLYASPLYRADQHSFLLYPAQELPGFLDKNIVPTQTVEENRLLTSLIAACDRTILVQDARGHFRFCGDFRNSSDLSAALDRLAGNNKFSGLLGACRLGVMEAYESTFNHRSFTGRSGAIYSYEGLGCIYWHMVAKLALAVQECHAQALRNDDTAAARLAHAYYRIREGLGFNKTAHEYGAFPPDPYSHTPGHSGARQPGMTGQAKEDILSRFGELGIVAKDGQLTLHPSLLRRSEFLAESASWQYIDLSDEQQTITLPARSLGFTLCQTPVVYRLTDEPARITTFYADGTRQTLPGNSLNATTSAEIFLRTGSIYRIEVSVPEETITLD